MTILAQVAKSAEHGHRYLNSGYEYFVEILHGSKIHERQHSSSARNLKFLNMNR